MTTRRAAVAGIVLALSALLAASPARADAVDTLRDFVRDVKSASANFTQTVTSADGAKKKVSSGTFEFLRPNRFRFAYVKPFEQLIVADGQKVWIYDADLNQVSTRKLDQAVGSTPAALLAGGSLDQDFTLRSLPSKDGLDWVEAVPRAREGSAFQSVKVAFRGKALAAFEIADNFGQHSFLQFDQLVGNPALPPERFKYAPPPGADVIEQ